MKVHRHCAFPNPAKRLGCHSLQAVGKPAGPGDSRNSLKDQARQLLAAIFIEFLMNRDILLSMAGSAPCWGSDLLERVGRDGK